MTVISNDVRHWLLIYKDGKEVVRWAVSERAAQNRWIKTRCASKESALRNSFRPRFTMGKYASTNNVKTYEDIYDTEMLREVFKTRKVVRGNLEYVYVVL